MSKYRVDFWKIMARTKSTPKRHGGLATPNLPKKAPEPSPPKKAPSPAKKQREPAKRKRKSTITDDFEDFGGAMQNMFKKQRKRYTAEDFENMPLSQYQKILKRRKYASEYRLRKRTGDYVDRRKQKKVKTPEEIAAQMERKRKYAQKYYKTYKAMKRAKKAANLMIV